MRPAGRWASERSCLITGWRRRALAACCARAHLVIRARRARHRCCTSAPVCERRSRVFRGRIVTDRLRRRFAALPSSAAQPPATRGGRAERNRCRRAARGLLARVGLAAIPDDAIGSFRTAVQQGAAAAPPPGRSERGRWCPSRAPGSWAGDHGPVKRLRLYPCHGARRRGAWKLAPRSARSGAPGRRPHRSTHLLAPRSAARWWRSSAGTLSQRAWRAPFRSARAAFSTHQLLSLRSCPADPRSPVEVCRGSRYRVLRLQRKRGVGSALLRACNPGASATRSRVAAARGRRQLLVVLPWPPAWAVLERQAGNLGGSSSRSTVEHGRAWESKGLYRGRANPGARRRRGEGGRQAASNGRAARGAPRTRQRLQRARLVAPVAAACPSHPAPVASAGTAAPAAASPLAHAAASPALDGGWARLRPRLSGCKEVRLPPSGPSWCCLIDLRLCCSPACLHTTPSCTLVCAGGALLLSSAGGGAEPASVEQHAGTVLGGRFPCRLAESSMCAAERRQLLAGRHGRLAAGRSRRAGPAAATGLSSPSGRAISGHDAVPDDGV
jgi:hypothetical protein